MSRATMPPARTAPWLLALLLSSQLAAASRANRPGAVPCAPDIVSISLGRSFCLALDRDGTVWAWGWNWNGELGNGTFNKTAPYGLPTPARVTGLDRIVAIAAGGYHALALRSDGTLWSWGANEKGQLGDGATSASPLPRLVGGLSDVTAIRAGPVHTLALHSDGTVSAWGYNRYGQLGTGDRTDSSVPVPVPDVRDVIALAAGYAYSMVLEEDGTVWAWGDNGSGQLGSGTASPPILEPSRVTGLDGVVAIASGWAHAMALRTDGTVWTWGRNDREQLGAGAGGPGISPVPLEVGGVDGVVTIGAGMSHSFAIKGDQTLWIWGYNVEGQLGNGSTVDAPAPIEVAEVGSVTAAAAGEYHTLALLAAAGHRSWGGNRGGQLGDGSYSDSLVPIAVVWPDDTLPPDQGNVLRASRWGSDVRLDFPGAPATLWRVYRDASKLSLGTTPLSPDAVMPRHVDPSVMAPALYRVRGLSPCSRTPGP